MIPLAVDLFCGLGGWTEGLMDEGYRVVGFDNERHVYGEARYPAQLVVQDVLTLHGRQFKDAALIVASPPCQAYSYRAMPWSRAKALPPPDNALFEACFRIQREACEAAGRHIPLVVENVCGAQKWVGRARWHYGSFYLWGDVPALMPIVRKQAKVGGFSWSDFGKPDYKPLAFNGEAERRLRQRICDCGHTEDQHGFRPDEDCSECSCINPVWVSQTFSGVKTTGHVNQRDGYGHTRHLTNQAESDAVKVSGDWFGSYADMKAKGTISPGRLHGKGSIKRKAASAHIAKIPYELARWIARAWWPR